MSNKTLSALKAAFSRQPYINILRLASNVADTETVVIGGQTYEMDSAAESTITAGNIRVNVNAGLTPTIASAALVAAIAGNASSKVNAVALSVNEILIWSKPGMEQPLACTETLAGANNAWAAAAMYPSASALENRAVQMASRVPTAGEVGVGNMRFKFNFTVAHAMAAVRVTSTGVVVAHDGGLSISGSVVTLSNAGSVDWAATDTVTVIASA